MFVTASVWQIATTPSEAQRNAHPGIEFSAAAGSPYDTSPMTGRPAVGDCNGDGWPDIVVAAGTC
jgi:hypothetical protein